MDDENPTLYFFISKKPLLNLYLKNQKHVSSVFPFQTMSFHFLLKISSMFPLL